MTAHIWQISQNTVCETLKCLTHELCVAAENLITSHPDDLNISCVEEINQFESFTYIFTDEEPQDIIIYMYRLIIEKDVQDNFPNIH